MLEIDDLDYADIDDEVEVVHIMQYEVDAIDDEIDQDVILNDAMLQIVDEVDEVLIIEFDELDDDD